MRLLADTHVLLAMCDKRIDGLGRPIAACIRDRDNTIYASVASFWEIAIKYRLGKLPLRAMLESLPEVIDDLGVTTLAVTAHQALATVDPAPSTRDPFDRLLLAVCQTEDMRLITTDRALVGHPLALLALVAM